MSWPGRLSRALRGSSRGGLTSLLRHHCPPNASPHVSLVASRGFWTRPLTILVVPHGKAVERYRLDVIDGGRIDE